MNVKPNFEVHFYKNVNLQQLSKQLDQMLPICRVGFFLEETRFFQDTWKKLEESGRTWNKVKDTYQELLFKTLFYLICLT